MSVNKIINHSSKASINIWKHVNFESSNFTCNLKFHTQIKILQTSITKIFTEFKFYTAINTLKEFTLVFENFVLFN